jgi:UDP-2-acetamido-3-amino-2,3-dideoxy-glucuronate N-acetyltransferase
MKEPNYYRHPQSLVESSRIGENSRVWAFAHVLAGAQIGSECNICDHVFIENDVVLGNRVTVKCGVQLWDGITLEDDVFIGPNVTFTNDPFPRSQQYPREFQKTIVRRGASIGANATILGGVVIQRNAMIGAGAVVTRDVPANAIVVGNPAQIIGYAGSSTLKMPVMEELPNTLGAKHHSSVDGVFAVRLPHVVDLRGSLSFAEYGQFLPFAPQRYFLVFDVPNREIRGEHAHHRLEQFLVCVRGTCNVVVDDGLKREQILLNSPTVGLYVPPMVWSVQYRYSPDSMLLVLASDVYRADDYVRDYEEFLRFARARQ